MSYQSRDWALPLATTVTTLLPLALVGLGTLAAETGGTVLVAGVGAAVYVMTLAVFVRVYRSRARAEAPAEAPRPTRHSVPDDKPAAAAPAPVPPPHPPRKKARRDLLVSGLGFRYAVNGPIVLSGIDVAVPGGALVAIVGPTGSGKSTLASLLAGRLTPTAGSVTLGGAKLSSMDGLTLRASVGLVTDEAPMFAASLGENVAAGDPEVSFDQLIAVSRAVGLHDDVMTMPDGYHTAVTDGGASLTAAQRQRVAIARALLKRPGLLVLDEAIGEIPPLARLQLLTKLAGFGCTCIVTAKDLRDVPMATTVVPLEGGRGTTGEQVTRPAESKTRLLPVDRRRPPRKTPLGRPRKTAQGVGWVQSSGIAASPSQPRGIGSRSKRY
jgi:ABC-type multidrug transport system fused ATPase/permease subunit